MPSAIQVQVTSHAMDRMRERSPQYSQVPDHVLFDRICEMVRNGTVFGVSLGSDRFISPPQFLCRDDVIFVCRQGDFGPVVTTTLTKDQAIANMQAIVRPPKSMANSQRNKRRQKHRQRDGEKRRRGFDDDDYE